MKTAIKTRQFILLAVLSSIIFKLGMLPSMAAAITGKDSPFTVFLLCLIDAAMIIATLFVAKNGGILHLLSKTPQVHKTPSDSDPSRYSGEDKRDPENQNANMYLLAKILIILPLLGFFIVKIIIYSSEVISYTSNNLFDGIKWVIIVIAILPIVFLTGRKKLYVLGRLAQICLWIAAVAIIFNLIFNTFQLNIRNMLPLATEGTGKILSSPFRLLWYAGDCLPLMFAKITHCDNDMSTKKAIVVVMIIPILIALYYALCSTTYGDALAHVSHVFSRLALFNSISDELGAFDLPFIASWLSMAVLSLSLYCYGVRHCMRAMTGKGGILYPLTIIAIGVVLSFYIKNYGIIERIFVFSPIAYIGSICLVLTVVLFVLTLIKKKKSTLNNMELTTKTLAENETQNE